VTLYFKEMKGVTQLPDRFVVKKVRSYQIWRILPISMNYPMVNIGWGISKESVAFEPLYDRL